MSEPSETLKLDDLDREELLALVRSVTLARIFQRDLWSVRWKRLGDKESAACGSYIAALKESERDHYALVELYRSHAPRKKILAAEIASEQSNATAHRKRAAYQRLTREAERAWQILQRLDGRVSA